MSTASGTLLASSTLISNDIIKKVWLKNISEKNYLILTRVNTLIVGVLAIIFALWIQDVLVALDVAYAILSGAIFVPFVVSFLERHSSKSRSFGDCCQYARQYWEVY